VADATALGIAQIAKATTLPKGKTAVSMRIAEQFIAEFGTIIENATTSILPADLAHLKSFLRSIIMGSSAEQVRQPKEVS
jgi:hypothetical protein